MLSLETFPGKTKDSASRLRSVNPEFSEGLEDLTLELDTFDMKSDDLFDFELWELRLKSVLLRQGAGERLDD
jgi:hypothetical protein